MDDYLTKPIQTSESQRVVAAQGGATQAGTTQADSISGEIAAPIFDRASALEAVDGDEALLNELISVFLEEAPSMLERVRTAAAGTDPKALSAAAHALKGAIAAIGAHRAAGAAQRAESLAREGRMEAARAAVDVALAEVRDLQATLSAPAALGST